MKRPSRHTENLSGSRYPACDRKERNMKINWEVRLKNPVWWFHVALAVVTPVLAYFGLTGADMTSWAKVWETILAAIANPYVVFLALVGAWNAINDPTTSGLSDSSRAMTYTEPYKEDK